jgi:hypothetical protein
MWTCPRCGRSFANRNQSHACGPLGLDRHLAGQDPEVVAIFRRLVELAERNGPVTVLAERTRIAFQVRMSFAAFARPTGSASSGTCAPSRALPG